MWEEINRKQNEEEMLQLQYYSRKLYNNSTRVFIFKIIVLIINIILAVIDKETYFLSTIFFIIFALLEMLEIKCVKKAAKARNLFDQILFEFKIPKDNKKVKERAYKLCKRYENDYYAQRKNTGTDEPPGLRNWYTKNNGKNKNEIIFKCQIENTKWDKKITCIDFIFFLVTLAIVIFICVFKYYNKTVSELILGILPGFELIYEIGKRLYLYYQYNNNLIKRKCLIEEFSDNKIQRKNLDSLQSLIEERRELDLVPLNFIHKRITQTMHDIIRKYN